MTKDIALPGLLTAAALATAVAVVANPVMPSLPDVQIPALFPSQLVVPPAAKAAIGAAATATIPAIQTAVEGLDRTTSVVQQAVRDIADVVLPTPRVSAVRNAARSLGAVADPVRPPVRTIPLALPPIVASSALAGVQRNTNRTAAPRSGRPTVAVAPQNSAPSAAPPPMAAVSVPARQDSTPQDSTPQDSTPTAKTAPEPSQVRRQPGQRRG